MTVTNFPNSLPTCTIGFQGSRKLDPRITFTRATGGGFVGTATSNNNTRVFNFPQNVPRLTNRGLLIEGSRTNREINSEAFSAWLNNGNAINVTDNAETAPDGTQTASRLANTNTAGAGRSLFSRTQLARTGQQTAQQLWIRRVAGTDPQPTIRLQTIGGGPGIAIVPTNQWQRIISVQTTLNDGGTFNCQQLDFTGNWDVNGTANDNVYAIWGSQFENNTGIATSYIPTAGAQVTRAADICDILAADFDQFYNVNQSTVVTATQVDWTWAEAGANNQRIFHSSQQNGDPAQIQIFYNATNDEIAGTASPGIVASSDLTNAEVAQGAKAAVSINTQNSTALFSSNGEDPQNSGGNANVVNPDFIRLGGLTQGNDRIGRDQLFGFIQGVSIYSTNLTQDNLNSLTTVQT